VGVVCMLLIDVLLMFIVVEVVVVVCVLGDGFVVLVYVDLWVYFSEDVGDVVCVFDDVGLVEWLWVL